MLNQKTRGKKHNLVSLEESFAISYLFLYQVDRERGLKEKTHQLFEISLYQR